MFDSNGVVSWWCSLLACIVHLSFAQFCPPQELISPCTCKTPLITFCSGIEQLSVLKRVFRNSHDRPMYQVDLEDSALMYFPAEALIQKKIQNLTITRSILLTVFDRVLDKNEHLDEFRMTDTWVLRGIEWKLFKNFQYLLRLKIKGTHIGKLGKEFRDNMPTYISELVLENAKGAWLADRVFDKLYRTTELHVTGGKISTLKRSMFPKKDNWLLVLNFNDNKISNLPEDIFSDMNRLKTVLMRGNRLTTISQSVFGKIFEKVDINLNDNKIGCDCGIRWIMKSEKTKLYATCDWPSNYKGKPIKEIPKQEFKYCDNI